MGTLQQGCMVMGSKPGLVELGVCYVCSLMIDCIVAPACVPSTCYVMPCIVTL